MPVRQEKANTASVFAKFLLRRRRDLASVGAVCNVSTATWRQLVLSAMFLTPPGVSWCCLQCF